MYGDGAVWRWCRWNKRQPQLRNIKWKLILHFSRSSHYNAAPFIHHYDDYSAKVHANMHISSAISLSNGAWNSSLDGDDYKPARSFFARNFMLFVRAKDGLMRTFSLLFLRPSMTNN